jgi:ankyrin repeat protein
MILIKSKAIFLRLFLVFAIGLFESAYAAQTCEEAFKVFGISAQLPNWTVARFGKSMSEGMLLRPEQSDLFEIYKRTFFGDPKSSHLGTLKNVTDILSQHPELTKPHFREYIISTNDRVYDSPESLNKYLKSINSNAGQIRSNLFQIEANLGFWKKLLNFKDLKPPVESVSWSKEQRRRFQDQTKDRFLRYLDRVISAPHRKLLLDESIDYRAKIKTLYHLLSYLADHFKKNGQDHLALRQALVDLVATTGFNNPATQVLLKSKNALDKVEGIKKIFDERDSMAMELGFENHFSELMHAHNIESPSFTSKSISESKLIKDLETETLQSPFQESSASAYRVRSLSIQEAPFRSCIGGSDCSSKTYFSKALDPNFNYFTLTGDDARSSGQVTVVLGEAKDSQNKKHKVAFIDKLQNVPNQKIITVLQAIKLSVAERGYLLALPKDVGDHNGLSNMDSTRQFVTDEVLSELKTEVLKNFQPHLHQYRFENVFSRAYSSLSVQIFEWPLNKNDAVIKAGDLYEPHLAPTELQPRSLVQELMQFRDSENESEILKFINAGESIKALGSRELTSEFTNDLLKISSNRNQSFKIRKQAAIERMLLSSDMSLFFLSDSLMFSKEERAQLLSEINQWYKSSDSRKRAVIHQVPALFATALKNKNLVVLNALTALPWFSVNMPGESGRSALNWAARKGDVDAVYALLKYPGVDVNNKDDSGHTPIYQAVTGRFHGLVQLFAGIPQVNVNATTNTGWTALVRAVQVGGLESVKILLAHPKIDVNLKASDGWNALMWAVNSNQVEIIKELIKKPQTQINFVTKDRDTILSKALSLGDEKLLQVLIEHPKTDVNLPTKSGLTPLMEVAKGTLFNSLNLLLKDPRTNVNTQNSEGETALMLAIQDKKKWAADRKVRALLADQRVDVNVKNKNGKSALDLAREENLSLSLRLKIRFRQQSLPYMWKPL